MDAASGADRVRTDDPRLAKPMLSQLSYSPEGNIGVHPRVAGARVGAARLELATPRLSSACSNQLSYAPACADIHSLARDRRCYALRSLKTRLPDEWLDETVASEPEGAALNRSP